MGIASGLNGIGRSCTSVLVGRAATQDGSVLIARNEDNSTPTAPKSLRMVPARNGGDRNFKSGANGFSMMLPETGMRYSAIPDVTPEDGLFEEAGINAAHVAMSCTESAYANNRVLAFDPFVETGISEDAMLTVVLPYVRTAREGVARLGSIVAEYGTAEANGVLFADHMEAWYMEIATGHHWVAQRIPDDCVAVVPNQLAIQEVDFNSVDFMCSTGIREFVDAYHLNPDAPAVGGQPFNFRRIFGTSTLGDRRYNTPRTWDGMRLLAPALAASFDVTSDDMPFVFKPERLLGVEDVAAVLSSHFDETDFDPLGSAGTPFSRTRYRAISLSRTQESHVLQLDAVSLESPAECAQAAVLGQLPSPICWIALGTPSFSPYMPLFTDAPTWPEEFDNATPTPDLNHPYWVFRGLEAVCSSRWSVASKRCETYKNDQWQYAMAQAESTRQAVQSAVPGERELIYQNANTACAQRMVDDARKQLAELLLDLSIASPLSYTMNPDL